jgi:hypothetical protein
MEKIHYVYEIRNLVNGKVYIGKHTTSEIDDGYFGSGIILRLALKKYGKDSFTKTILAFCATEDDAYNLEGCLINECDQEKLYNISGGGRGAGSGNQHPMYGKKHTDSAKSRIGGSRRGEKHWNYGSHRKPNFELTDEILKKRGASIAKTVLQIDIESNTVIAEFNGCRDAAEAIGIDRIKGGIAISKCARGNKYNKTMYGYKWLYKT